MKNRPGTIKKIWKPSWNHGKQTWNYEKRIVGHQFWGITIILITIVSTICVTNQTSALVSYSWWSTSPLKITSGAIQYGVPTYKYILCTSKTYQHDVRMLIKVMIMSTLSRIIHHHCHRHFEHIQHKSSLSSTSPKGSSLYSPKI